MSPTLQSVENFISFSCLVALARTWGTMLNRNGESRYLGFVHNFRRKYSD